jgi:hypothetical protein
MLSLHKHLSVTKQGDGSSFASALSEKERIVRQRTWQLKFGPAIERLADELKIVALFAWLISHQPAVLSSQNKSATSNQPAVLFCQNKSAPAISHQPTEQNRQEKT